MGKGKVLCCAVLVFVLEEEEVERLRVEQHEAAAVASGRRDEPRVDAEAAGRGALGVVGGEERVHRAQFERVGARAPAPARELMRREPLVPRAQQQAVGVEEQTRAVEKREARARRRHQPLVRVAQLRGGGDDIHSCCGRT